MLADERHTKILHYLSEHGSAKILALSKLTDVSIDTVRRYLDTLNA